MYINQIDNLFDGVINNFNIFLEKKKVFEKISKDSNYVKFQNTIIDLIKEFTLNINNKEIDSIIHKKSHKDLILNIIKRYCAFYIYLGISYNYKDGRDLFVTNLIEIGKNQKDSTFQIDNFYNSENNSKIIEMFSIIKNILELKGFKTMDRIKIILSNNPIKYEKTLDLFNDLGEDFINEYFLVSNNFHNIIKTFIFKQIYLKEEKSQIISVINEEETDHAEYKYIEIVVSRDSKLIDFNFFQSYLTIKELRAGLAEDYYSFLEENREEVDIKTLNNKQILDFLFSNKILIPITEEFLRYHKSTERYDRMDDLDNIKDRDATKIKYIINKLNKTKNLYSSIYEKNPKLKLDALNLFYKPLKDRDVILYNENEEVKIIQKLEQSEKSTDSDYLVDLENARNYSYINFKDFSKDGFRLRTSEVIHAIRHVNIKNTIKKQLELRVGHNNLPLNVIGIAYNPSLLPLECFTIKKMVNIKDKEKNGYEAFIKILDEHIIDSSKGAHDSIYYWLFDSKTDIVKLDQYKNVSSFNTGNYIETMVVELFNKYIDLFQKQVMNKIDKSKNVNLWKINNIINQFTKDNFKFNNINFNLSRQVIADIVNKYINDIKVKNIDDVIKDKEIIKLPYSDKIKKKNIIIPIGQVEIVDVDIKGMRNMSVCHHYIKWYNINKISKKFDEERNQAIFDFVKQYVKLNERGDYICKSCEELLNLKKYVYEGTYVKELDVFLTTSLAVSQNLHEIPKYAKHTRTIRNIEKNIEKICYTINLNYYLGNTPAIKLRRKMVIKDVIDLILIHTNYLKNQPKDRIAKAVENYNIHKDLTNLFFFELKDDIFLTSSTDTDYYKLIKFNNVIAYIILILITEINVGHIISLKDDKKCNFFLYKKVGYAIFENLFIRLDSKVKISIANIPLLGYVIYYLSCALSNSYIWLWNSEEKSQIYNVQKTIIHTVVDLMNTLIEANMEKDKNFLYELIVTRLLQRIKSVYNDKNVLKLVDEESNKKIHIDKATNKVGYIVKKPKIIILSEHVDDNNESFIIKDTYCESKTTKLEILEMTPFNNELNILTNCLDGKFHNWVFKDNNLLCSNCNKNYNELVKEFTETESDKSAKVDTINQVKLVYLRKLANTYCLSGELHEIDPSTNICEKCKINLLTKEYSNNELFKLEKNLKSITDTKLFEQINKMKQHLVKQKKKRDNINTIINKMDRRYVRNTNNKLINYIDDFVDNLIKNVGKKIKINNGNIYLNDTLYEINNDYLGNETKNTISILSSDNKMKVMVNHPHFKKDVLYYHDKDKKVYVFYDSLTKNYLGYSKDNKSFKTYKSNAYLKITFSIKDMILNLGLENRYINVYHINHLYLKNKRDVKSIPSTEIIDQLIRNRINNLKQVIFRSVSIIEKLKNNYSNKTNPFNKNEYDLINEFNKILKSFNTTDKTTHKNIFKHLFIISNNLKLESIPEKIELSFNNQYFDSNLINSLNNTDNKLLFYYLYNMTRLIEYNEQSAIKTNLSYFVIKLIIYSFNQYYVPIENIQVRKFDLLLINDTPYIDESLKVVGYYQDLVNANEVDEEANKEKEYNLNEEMNALDIDDYDANDLYDDFDPSDDVVEDLIKNA